MKSREIGFTVDAGLIDRLGRELVGRAETAVSELIKNSYDADATQANVTFIDSNLKGGTLIIEDNGVGMTESQLEFGFMRISSTDKLHNPISERYGRAKAGRKGIGRFSTQRLGEKLIIITQTLESNYAISVEIDWSQYKVDQDITSISFPLKYIEKIKDEGTILRIEGLKEAWSESAIKRVFRYVSELLQPDYLSEKSREYKTATQKEQIFNVSFNRKVFGQNEVLANEQKMIFDKALATIDGCVDENGLGSIQISSNALDLNDTIRINSNKSEKGNFIDIRNVRFRVYYFIYNRHDYYKGRLSSLELRNIQTIADNSSGVRLYRNGFRVLPYGEVLDDWLALDKRWNVQSGVSAPLANKNFFGFVEIMDSRGDQYEETASREGLIETEAFIELKEYLHLAFRAFQLRLSSALIEPKKKRDQKNIENKKRDIPKIIQDIKDKIRDDPDIENVNRDLEELASVFQETIDEQNMLRVLAAMGLTIGEFTHEVIQFTPDITGYISCLMDHEEMPLDLKPIIGNLDFDIRNFLAYTAFFNTVVSENVSRETKPVSIRAVVNNFVENIQLNLDKVGINVKRDFYGYELYTIPMHISEWISILYNFYTNSKKAIKKKKIEGQISIICGEENGKIYLEFSDNGCGILEEDKEKVFIPFFTTSTPAGFSAPSDDQLLGTGLGLKIVKDIVESHHGIISLIEPETGFKTCFRIEIPKATKEQLIEYGM